jgi:FixJ family two-component response regulator
MNFMDTSSGTVYLVDDDETVHRALTRLLRSVGYGVRSFRSAEEFLREPRIDEPGCLLLDVVMPGMRGTELQQMISASGWDLKIVFLTGNGDIQGCADAMKIGAVDYLTKPIDESRLFGAIERAIRLDATERAARATRSAIEQRAAQLTPRESQVMFLVVAGRLNKQIAAELGTSEKTIKIHRARVMTKMCAHSVAELVNLASQVDAARGDASPRPTGNRLHPTDRRFAAGNSTASRPLADNRTHWP